MNLIGIIHWFFNIFCILIMFLPLKIIKYGLYFIPCIIAFLLIVFDGCLLNILEKKLYNYKLDNQTNKIKIKYKKKKSIYISSFIKILIPTIILFRIFLKYDFN